MAENKVRFLRGTAAEYANAVKDDDTFYYTTDDEKFYVGNKEITGDGITVDSELSDTSTNPVQNKVIKQAIDDKADGSHTHSKADITDFPASLPANGGNADTVDNKHYTDFSQNAVLSTIDQVNDPNLESGIYSAENVSMTFSPVVVSSWFMLIVNKHRASAGYGTQIAIPYDNGDQRGMFYRVCRVGTWGNWVRIADENTIANENLLLNPDFRINQQGKSEYIGHTECWDKWTVSAGWKTARSDDDLAALFTCVTPQVSSWVVNQQIPNYKDYRGKTVTFSAHIVTTSTKFSLLINDGVNQLGVPVTTGQFSVTYRVSDNATRLSCVICANGQEVVNEQIAVVSTKLEIGSIATAFVPLNPAIEIAKVRAANDAKPYVTGSVTTATKTVTTNHGFTPSAVFYWVPSQGSWFCGSATFDTTSFQISFLPSESIVVNYLIFR